MCGRQPNGIVQSVSNAPAAEATDPPSPWWAPGLSMAERLPLPEQPSAPWSEAACGRLDHWRSSGTPADERFADAGLTEREVLALLAEPSAALAARSTPLTWVEFIEAALAALPPHPVPHPAPPVTSETPLAAFLPVLRPFLDLAAARIAEGLPNGIIALPSVLAGLSAQLGARLVRMAGRTLVVELNTARLAGRLRGGTPAERFADFLAGLGRGPALRALLHEYPVLARLIGQACEQAVAAHLELLRRLAADRTEIVTGLLGGVDPGALADVAADSGDAHGQGRAVAILRFANGAKVVYKPRAQAVQAHLADLLGWLNARLPGIGLRAAAALPRTGYGWLEFIEHRPCAEIAELDRFYRRQGALLALLYALDGIDIHYENLIACVDQPVLVDVETLFHPTPPPVMITDTDPANAALASSVLRTALLPQLLVGEYGALDLSGLGGDKGGRSPLDAVTWESAGTDEMRLVCGQVPFEGAANRPSIDGDDADPADYQAALLTGFRLAYDAIAAHRAELLGPAGLLARFADDEIRVVVRPTQIYARLLDESTHPDTLREGLDHERVFDLLWAHAAPGSIQRRVAGTELTDLWAGDVPLFTGRPGSRDLWTTSGQRLRDVLPEPSLAAVTGKIAAMDAVDRHDQEWVIAAALATRSGPIDHHSGPTLPGHVTSSAPDRQRVLAAACGIADELVARSVPDARRANWLAVELVDGRHWSVLPMGAGLGDGYTGVALFLAQLAELTSTRRYRDLARRALEPIPQLLAGFTAQPELVAAVGSGGFLGLGGISYALARIGTLLADEEILSWLPAAVSLTAAADDPAQSGLFLGTAGALAAMLAVHADTGLAAAGDLARRLADRLATRFERAPLADQDTGFANGHSGIGFALARYAERNHSAAHAELARTALSPDGSTAALPARPGTPDIGWCSGLSGMVLAQSATSADRGEGHDRAIRLLTDRNPLRDSSLCHGELGVLDALTALGSPALEHAARQALGAIEHYGPRCATPSGVASPGLLTGLAGIGYGLLRLGFSDHVPSVLLLEAGRPDPGIPQQR